MNATPRIGTTNASATSGGETMAADWLFQTVDVPLWGVFVLTAYSARRLAAAVSGIDRLRRRSVSRAPEAGRDETGSGASG